MISTYPRITSLPGYSDVSTEGSWRWVDCNATNDWQSALDIWATGEPSAAEDCATLGGPDGQMYGQICDQKFSFICEVSQKGKEMLTCDAGLQNKGKQEPFVATPSSDKVDATIVYQAFTKKW